MNKLEDLQKLKSLLDEGILTEEEFLKMKKEILSTGTNKEIKNQSEETAPVITGNLNIRFAGEWFLFDANTKLFVNGQLHSTHSTKKGFNVDVKINSEKILLKLVLAGMKSTIYEIDELDASKGYSMELIYSNTWGRYSNKFKLIENG